MAKKGRQTGQGKAERQTYGPESNPGQRTLGDGGGDHALDHCGHGVVQADENRLFMVRRHRQQVADGVIPSLAVPEKKKQAETHHHKAEDEAEHVLGNSPELFQDVLTHGVGARQGQARQVYIKGCGLGSPFLPQLAKSGVAPARQQLLEFARADCVPDLAIKVGHLPSQNTREKHYRDRNQQNDKQGHAQRGQGASAPTQAQDQAVQRIKGQDQDDGPHQRHEKSRKQGVQLKQEKDKGGKEKRGKQLLAIHGKIVVHLRSACKGRGGSGLSARRWGGPGKQLLPGSPGQGGDEIAVAGQEVVAGQLLGFDPEHVFKDPVGHDSGV